MPSRDSAVQPCVAFVDHQRASLTELIRTLGLIRRTTPDTLPLGELFRFVPVVVQPGKTLVDRVCAAVTGQCGGRPDLVLVDLAYGVHESDAAFDNGRDLARQLLPLLQPTAVGVYSRNELRAYERVMLSTDGFAIVLERIRELVDSRDYHLRGDQWVAYFQAAMQTSAQAGSGMLAATAPIKREFVNWAAGQPRGVSRSLVEAAPRLAALLLGHLPAREKGISLALLGGGFSGAYLIKATCGDGPAAFVIKIDEFADRVRRELAGYDRVMSSVAAKYYLSPVNAGDRGFAALRDDWWGALAMQYEGDARPLIEQADVDLASLYQRVWADCLQHLYGELNAEELRADKALTPDAIRAAGEAWEAMGRYHGRTAELGAPAREAVARVTGLLQGHGIPSTPASPDPMAQHIHGDLNCRNILYNSSDQSFKLIDFPHVDKGSVAADFAKAEAELVVLIMDWASGKDCGVSRLPVWFGLTGALSRGLVLDASAEVVGEDEEVRRVFRAACAMRNAYHDLAGHLGEVEHAYRLHLMAKLLPYLGYRGVTAAKRLLAMCWIGQLLDAAW